MTDVERGEFYWLTSERCTGINLGSEPHVLQTQAERLRGLAQRAMDDVNVIEAAIAAQEVDSGSES